MVSSSHGRPEARTASSPSPTDAAGTKKGPSPLWALLLVIPWTLLVALANYGTWRSCGEGHWDPQRLKLYPDTLSYCDAVTKEQFLPTLLVLTASFAVVAAIWVGIALLLRARRRRGA